MKTYTYSDARANLARVFDEVTDDAEEAVVTRSGGREPVVIVSMSEWSSIQETAYLMRSPANARRLLTAIAELEAGQGEVHELIDPDAASAAA